MLQESQQSDELTQRHLVQRLDRIENTVAMIEDAMLIAQEEGETRHTDLLHHLEDLKMEVVANNKILKKLRDRGWLSCCAKKECIFLVVIASLMAWLYFLQNINLSLFV